jgi:cytosine/adenosine deaminase-related metal-dependent hydrolase
MRAVCRQLLKLPLLLAVMTTWVAAPAAFGAEALLIRGAYVMSMDPAIGDLPVGDVLIERGRITGVGRDLAVPANTRVMAGVDKVVLPGFVDVHSHLWITQLRGRYGNTASSKFFSVTNQLGPHYTPEDTRLGIEVGAVEGLAGGITTVVDFFDNVRDPRHAEAALAGLRDARVRGRLMYGAASKTTPAPIDLAHIEALQADWKNQDFSARLSLGLAWRLPPRLDDEQAWAPKLRELAAARKLGLPISVHLSGTGDQAIKMFDALIARKLLGPDLQVVHATDARPDQLAALDRAGASLALTPLTEQRVGYGLTRVSQFTGVTRQGLGTDGTALAGAADMFGTMRLAAFTDTGAARDETAASPRRLLELATREGAISIGMGAEIGTITKGKWADLQIIDMKALNLAPFIDEDPAALIVYSARPENVATVLVGGQVVKDEGRMVGVDTDTLVQALQASARALSKRDVP